SGVILTYAFGASAFCSSARPLVGRYRLITSPVPAAVEVLMNARRDGALISRISPAAADVRRHELSNLGIRRMRRLGQQCRGCHDLSALTVAALRHVFRDP